MTFKQTKQALEAFANTVIKQSKGNLRRHRNNKFITGSSSGDLEGSLGYDLKVMTKSPESAKELVTKGSQLSLRMLSFPKPIVIACSGHAIAKGAFLLLSADYRIGVEGDFKIGLNEVQIGMTMHHAGIAIAKTRLSEVYINRSVVNAELYNPKQAVNAGFLDVVVPENHLLPTAIKVASLFAKLNTKAHAETKLKVRKQHLLDLESAIQLDLESDISIRA